MTTPPIDDFELREALLDEWVATRREIARLEAKASSLLAERMRLCNEDVKEYSFHRDTIYRSMIAEYSAAGRISKGSLEYAFHDATTVDDHFPAVAAAFAAGSISAAHVREIVRAARSVQDAVRAGDVSPEVYSLYEAAALVVAEEDTPMRTRKHARQVAAALSAKTVQERHEFAADERAVTLRSLDDGLALLSVVLPEALGVAIYDRLTRMTTQIVRNRKEDAAARRARSADAGADSDRVDPFFDPTHPAHEATVAAVMSSELLDLDPDEAPVEPPLDDDFPVIPDTIPEWVLAGRNATPKSALEAEDTRTYDQIRTDILVDMLLASDPSAVLGRGLDSITAHIQVTVAATTLAGIDEKLAELDGHGPLHPDIARDLAGRNGGWTRLFLSPDAMVIETDTYSPTESMKRFLRARDQHCRFPGCSAPAARCDIDHNHDHAKGGATHIDNLTHLCRSHHTLKHPELRDEDCWTARLAPDGSLEWQSPLGRNYADRPARRVMFQ